MILLALLAGFCIMLGIIASAVFAGLMFVLLGVDAICEEIRTAAAKYDATKRDF
jgi:hypothetical protein